MKKSILLPLCLTLFCLHGQALATDSLTMGAGFNFRGNTSLRQLTVGLNHELPMTTEGQGWRIRYSVELEGADIIGDGVDGDTRQTFRLSLMPQAHLWLGEMVRLTAGLGAGFMAGEVEFEDHDLGGPFLLNSKLGAELVMGSWSVGYTFYHQSNAGIYDNNASLNMNCVGVSFHF